MDETDKKILNIIQTDFPVVAEPFKVIASMTGISEGESLARIKKLKDDGIIRRIGAVFDARKLGFASTLCAAKVPEGKLKTFIEAVNAYPGVTHNYRRNHEYNVWFTVIAPSGEELKRFFTEVTEKTGITEILSMRASRIFKINASFEM
ncbi:MAG: Lrp/AsnC family transcriptional regulator [Syntrophobacterales bacterium CG_4_8_14_3_um_filter_49_14]|nr:MAG: AsnC family protein [Syntrophobacterales bacterium CG23_combo_of_CG06-09_8_20_14_all_48_27]PJC73151.1 MAG: Lrp/AsnC family transcriptional regulator [Syntrophobacterales bacterium CG_4_8_14_3_um_filter_49_14]